MPYPKTFTEFETMQAAVDGRNLSRFGDGELRLATGGKSASQHADTTLMKELCTILAGRTDALPCIPGYRIQESPRSKFWSSYYQQTFMDLYTAPEYGSSWVTRPDSAPWIDIPEYWNLVTRLWRGREVVFVAGKDPEMRIILDREARRVRHMSAPPCDAYRHVDTLVEELRTEPSTVLLSIGAAATVAAHRLASHGVHAVDIGHMSRFMTVQGAYEFSIDDLATPQYRDLLHGARNEPMWVGRGHLWAALALAFAADIEAVSILDYGCGVGSFKRKVKKLRPKMCVDEYDPGIPGKDLIPKPADMILCTNVYEHVEPSQIHKVLEHQFRLARKGMFSVVCLKEANKCLPDGRNARILIRSPEWWHEALKHIGWSVEVVPSRDKYFVVKCRK